MNNILVLGGSGLVGQSIINEISKQYQYQYQYQIYASYFKNDITLNLNGKFKLNVEDEKSINGILDVVKPQIIISCLRGNFEKQLNLHSIVAGYLKKCKGKLYYCSTTNVFDDDLSKSHYEDSPVNANSDYGKFKIECEKMIGDILDENAVIVRLPQVWGRNAARMKELISSLNNKKKILVYPNLFINTITDVAIAQKLIYIIEHKLKGIFHLAADDIISYKDFFEELIKGLGFKNAKLEENFDEKGYFTILSNRNNEFPKQLRMTNKSVINYLLEK